MIAPEPNLYVKLYTWYVVVVVVGVDTPFSAQVCWAFRRGRAARAGTTRTRSTPCARLCQWRQRNMRDISEHLRELDEHGYTTFENLLSVSDVNEARSVR